MLVRRYVRILSTLVYPGYIYIYPYSLQLMYSSYNAHAATCTSLIDKCAFGRNHGDSTSLSSPEPSAHPSVWSGAEAGAEAEGGPTPHLAVCSWQTVAIMLCVLHSLQNIRVWYTVHLYNMIVCFAFTLHFKCRAFSRRFYPEERETQIYRCRYSKDVHRTKCQALTITRLTHSTVHTNHH